MGCHFLLQGVFPTQRPNPGPRLVSRCCPVQATGLLIKGASDFPGLVLVVVQSLSRIQLCDPTDCSTPGLPAFTISQSLLRLLSIESVVPSNCLILCRPLLLLPSIFPSIRVFSNELALHIRWPKDWSFSFSISPSSEYSGLVSFRMDCLDLLAFQGTLKSLLQHHGSKASIFQFSKSLWSNSHIHT